MATAAALAVSGIAVVGLSAASPVEADPASGVGKLTVDDSGHWFEYDGNGEPYFMAGSGGPEGFLYYSDQKKQEIVDALIANDVRAVYIHAVRSDDGDGGSDENPFFSNSNKVVDPAVLDEWDFSLSQLDEAGIVTWFHLYDDGARPFTGACDSSVPQAEQDFVKTIVERFRDYRHIVWLPTEEHQIKRCGDAATDRAKAANLAAEIRKHDTISPLGVHHNNGQSNQYLGNTDIDVFAQQVCQQSRFTSVDGLHLAGEGQFGEDVYVMAECHPWHKDLLAGGNANRTTLRQSFWGSVMAGGYMLFYDAWEQTDPTDEMLADIGRINEFMDTTRFSDTEPADQLAAGGTKWVLGNEDLDVYIAYSNENPSTMGVQGLSAGTYRLGWFDPVTGATVTETATVSAGTATFQVPSQIGSEVALSITPSDSTPPVTTAPPATTAPPVTTTPPETTAPPATTTPPETTVPPVTTTPPETTVPPVTTTPPETTVPGDGAVTLLMSADVYIEGATVIGSGELRVESGSRTRTTYLGIDTSDITAAGDVRLRMVVGSDPGDGQVQVAVGSGDRTAETMTPTTAPVPGPIVASVDGPFVTGQVIEFSLPVEVIDGDWLDLVVTHTGAGSDDVSFAPSDTGDGPALVVERSTTQPTTTQPTTTQPTTTQPTTTQPTTTQPGTGVVVDLRPIEDAFLQLATRVNGDQLRVEAAPRVRTSYLRFDTSSIAGPATGSLALTVGSDEGQGDVTVSIAAGAAGDWTDDTLSTDNAPTAGQELASVSGPFASGDRVVFELGELDVGEVLDLVVTSTGAGVDDVSFDASELASGPVLSLDASGTVQPTTTVPATTVPTTVPTTTVPATTVPTTTIPATTVPTGPDSAEQTVSFEPTGAVVPNPERGFHRGVSVADSASGSTTSVSSMRSMYAEGIRLARMYVRLDDYRNSPIPSSLLDNLDEVFANAREAGIKLVPRFSYNFGTAPDAPLEQIEQHLEQVTPILEGNSDVITALQAGFIGRWGEWNGSTNDLLNPADKARVRDALIEALPAERMIQFRYPDDLIEFEPVALTAADAFTGSPHSRTAHKSDCFLANESDAGTYTPSSRKPEFVGYLSAMTEFTVMGGETCNLTPNQQRTDCPTAIAELDQFNWDYLNLDFFDGAMNRWRTEGCFEEIESRLGYRFELQEATSDTQADPGERLDLRVEIANTGFGKLYNPRPVNVVFVNDATGSATRVERVADARDVMPLSGETSTVDLGVQVPTGLPSGNYSIHLELPDGSATIADDPRYSIRLANLGTWRPTTGTNDLGLDVVIGESGNGGPTDPGEPVEPSEPTDPARVLFVRGADRSGGFLEAGNDAARTEQLADITNTSTNNGNHGWATFASTLRAAGYVVEQVTEGAEVASGPSDGRPVDLAGLDLDAYDLVVLGSNNAEYPAAQVAALDEYVRSGGAALFISDANFGGGWADAPNSDQSFLDRYGIDVYQDTGTYSVQAAEFVTPNHPVLAGVSAFDGEGVSPFDVGGATVPVTVLAAAEGGVRVNAGGGQGPTRPAGPDDAAAWVAEVGAGRLAGHFDRNTFFNANGAGTNIGRLDNERYAVNLVGWLTESD